MFFIERFIDKPIVVYLSTIFIALLSLFALSKLPIEDTPKIKIPLIYVQVPYPGAAAEEVESKILRKLEEKIDAIDYVKDIYSLASEGVGKVYIEFYDNIDMKDALRDVQNEVNSVRREFPDEAEYPIVGDIAIDNMPILLFSLYGDVSHFLLKDTAEEMQHLISTVSGVAEVLIFGGLEQEIHVNVNPIKSASYGITYSQISNSLKSQNMNFPGGHLKIENNEYLIRTLGEFKTVEEIGNTIIYSKDNKLLNLSDIAEIKDSHKKINTISRFNGKNSVTLAVRKQLDINTLKTIKTIRKLIKDMSSTLPPGINVAFSHDKSDQILRLVRQLGTSAIYGGILVVSILYVTIGFRNSVLISMAIPFSLLITALFLYIFNMSISGIALFSMILILGMVVDGAIIVGENIYQKFEQGMNGTLAAKKGVMEVAWPVVSSDLTTIAAFLPMLMVTGLSGQFLSVIPWVVTFALSGSMLVDHIILPTVAARVMKVRKRFQAKEFNHSGSDLSQPLQIKSKNIRKLQFIIQKCFEKIRNHYSKTLNYSFNHQKLVILFTVGAVIFSIILIISGFLGFEFFPKVDIGKFSIDFELPPGSSIEETDKIAKVLESRLDGIPEIVSFVTTLGNTQSLKSDIREGGKEGLEYGKISIELLDSTDRDRTQTEILENIKSEIGKIPGVDISYFELREGPPTGAEIAVKISGNNLDTLSNLSEIVQSELQSIPGATNIRSDSRKGRPELKIAVNREKSSIYGIDAGAIANAVSKSFLGYVATTINIDDEEVDVRIQNKNIFKKNIENVQNVYVPGLNGTSIPLGEIAKISLGNSISDIRRLNRKRTITIRSDVIKGFSADSIKKNLKIEMNNRGVPDDINIVYGGESEERDKSIKELFYSMILAMTLIYFILSIQFNSCKQPFMVMAAIPLSFVGVVLGLIITNLNFGFMAFVGMIALTGIVVNDSIVLISYANDLVEKGKNAKDAVIEAGQRRLRPILMTTVTTIGGLLPLTLNIGGGGDFWKPLGCSIIFGISAATYLTLVVIPVIYTFIENNEGRKGQLKIKKTFPLFP